MDRIDMGVLVVLFNPGDDDLKHLGELAAAFPQLRFLAVDNSPHSDPQRNARLRGQGIAVLHHGNRQGIAGAFNQGLDALFRRGVQGVLLLDQDSVPAAPSSPPSGATCRRATVRPACSAHGSSTGVTGASCRPSISTD